MPNTHSNVLNKVILEMSLKPFTSKDPNHIAAVCTKAFQQWHPLTSMAKQCFMQLWIAEGSDILMWSGDLDTPLEWAKYIGNNLNREYAPHMDWACCGKPYRESPLELTYRDLKVIIDIIKATGKNLLGHDIAIGATFDIGPEFAPSPFKFTLHKELLEHNLLSNPAISTEGQFKTICAWAQLHADANRYAGYPDGIPEGTSIGTFLGRQMRSYMETFGFDYLWLSNGFGFSSFPWSFKGVNFDGVRFGKVDLREIRSKILSFWEDFRKECPDCPIYPRGTNIGTAADIASDGTSLLDIYERGYVEVPPVNSPWAALPSSPGGDLGIEISGHMSRIALLPKEDFPFRYYPNDPWYNNNPWWQTYNREPYDIYCPLSIGRINGKGKIETPKVMNILTIDTERGVLDPACPREVIPHIQHAFATAPDQPGIITWLYPFREYHQASKDDPECAENLFFDDWFFRNAVNYGFPVNTVVSTDDFSALMDKSSTILENTIVVSPVSMAAFDYGELLQSYIRAGGNVLFYGPVNVPWVQDLLCLEHDEGIDGAVELIEHLPTDEYTCDETPESLMHFSHVSGGPIREVLCAQPDASLSVKAVCRKNKKERIYALVRQDQAWNGGRVAWVRGSISFDTKPGKKLPLITDNGFESSILLRSILSAFGYTFLQERFDQKSLPVRNFISRHDNGFYFSGHVPDTTTSVQYSFPDGAPVMTGMDTIVTNDIAQYTLENGFHKECRLFVKQKNPAKISCKLRSPGFTEKNRQVYRNIELSGLNDTQLTIYPPFEKLEKGLVEVQQDKVNLDLTSCFKKDRVVVPHVSGTVIVIW